MKRKIINLVIEIFRWFLAAFLGIFIVAGILSIHYLPRLPGSDEEGVGSLVIYLIIAALFAYKIVKLLEKVLLRRTQQGKKS